MAGKELLNLKLLGKTTWLAESLPIRDANSLSDFMAEGEKLKSSSQEGSQDNLKQGVSLGSCCHRMVFREHLFLELLS